MDHANLNRPRTIEEFRAAMKHLITEESLQRGLGMAVRPSDVIISTYAKSGTTWLQQVAHGVRSGGSMDFAEISDVVPWIEIASDLGQDIDAEHAWSPRVFKAHLTWHDVPKGARYIVSFRDPKTVIVSMYQFFDGWFFEPGSITLDDLGRQYFLATKRYFHHLLSWARVINQPQVLAMAYEDMLQSPERLPVVVAEFMQIDVADDLMARITYQSSRDFMVANDSKFDSHDVREKRDAIMGLPPGGASSRVQRATINKPKLSPDLAAEIDEVWRETITPVLGHATYEDFHKSLPNPLAVDR